MKIILSEIDLGCDFSPEGIQIKKVSGRTLEAFNHDETVIAVVGSRALASQCVRMELPGLRLYQLTSAGFDGVPCEEFARNGIAVANAGSVYSVPIAETVVFGMLAMAKKLRSNPNNRRFKYLRHYRQITELSGKRVLILGAGSIGTEVARRLAGFGMEIHGYDPYCPPKAEYGRILRDRQTLLNEVGTYDYLVSTLPDTEQTRGMINRQLLERMLPTTVIVNVGRKATIREDDLYAVLKQRRIAGAVLDMFEVLPNPVTNPFRRLRNVIVLPGVAAISKETDQRLKILVRDNVMNAVEERPLHHVINGVN